MKLAIIFGPEGRIGANIYQLRECNDIHAILLTNGKRYYANFLYAFDHTGRASYYKKYRSRRHVLSYLKRMGINSKIQLQYKHHRKSWLVFDDIKK